MTDPTSGLTPDHGDQDAAEAAALGRLFSDLADDPDAPASPVSALSVIAAAKSGGAATTGAAAATVTAPVARAAEVASTDRPAAPDQASVGELHVLSAQRDAEQRSRRRRTTILIGLAAACVVAIAAVVIPITLSSSGGTTTSAGSAADTVAGRASSAAAAAPSGESAEGESDAGGQAQGQADAGSSATIDPANPDANRPAPGENALTQTVPVPGGAVPTGAVPTGAVPTEATAGGAATSCWPALSDASAAALVGSLPTGAFGAPGLLGLGCPTDPVAGAELAGTAPDTQLVVRAIRADPGACAQSASETGAKCVARGGDQYVSNDGGNLSVYAYGNGYEVEVGGRPATGIAPIPSGLTADQLATAAAAVLSTLG